MIRLAPFGLPGVLDVPLADVDGSDEIRVLNPHETVKVGNVKILAANTGRFAPFDNDRAWGILPYSGL